LNLQGRLPGSRPTIFTQAADDEFDVIPVNHGGVSPPRPETFRMSGQGKPRAPQGFRRHIQFGCNLLTPHAIS